MAWVSQRTIVALLVFSIAALGLAAVGRIVQDFADHPTRGRELCPQRPRRVQPDGFHFSPGLAEHQSWIDFAVPEPDATSFTLCLDARLWERGIGHTPEHGHVQVSVNTRFIDLLWLSDRLNEFTRPDRWELGYTTYSLGLP